MNEVERYVVNIFKEENKNNEEYIYLSDEEILKINPATSQDYIDYYDRMIFGLKKDIESCLTCINEMEKDIQTDYIRRREIKEYIKEEKDEIEIIKDKIKEYINMKNYYLEQIDNKHIK